MGCRHYAGLQWGGRQIDHCGPEGVVSVYSGGERQETGMEEGRSEVEKKKEIFFFFLADYIVL